ncbi:MAG: 60S ribosomal protein L28 [Proteobacteria bacterium]|nr:60S ribosomal protein L28 [Pseudomonadota bacterium]
MSKVNHDSAALPLATSDVVFQITRKHNAFARAGRNDLGVGFTAEPNNVLNIAKRKYSAYGSSRTVGVEIRRGAKKGEILTVATPDSHTPAKNTKRTHLRINNKRSFALARKNLAVHVSLSRLQLPNSRATTFSSRKSQVLDQLVVQRKRRRRRRSSASTWRLYSAAFRQVSTGFFQKTSIFFAPHTHPLENA